MKCKNPDCQTTMSDGSPEYCPECQAGIDSAIPSQGPGIPFQIARVKSLRRDIDEQIQHAKSLPSSRERSLAITKLQEAVMWLGMDLKRINEENPGASPNPYPNSKDPSSTKIEPTADGLKL